MTKKKKTPETPVPAKPAKAEQYIYRPWRKTPDGKILFARDYGLRAWKIPVQDK